MNKEQNDFKDYCLENDFPYPLSKDNTSLMKSAVNYQGWLLKRRWKDFIDELVKSFKKFWR